MKHLYNHKIHIIYLSATLIFSRILFKAHYLYEWDSIQYALAIKDFDIMWHQPHPPGYILFVFILKLFAVIFKDINTVFLVVNILFSLGTVTIFYLLSSQLCKNIHLQFWSCLIFIVCPVFWFYGEIATIYIIEAFVSVTIAYFAFLSLENKNTKTLYFLSFLFGLLGGIRQTTLILFAPLWLYVLFLNRDIKRLLSNLFYFVTGLALWTVPTIISVNGLNNYIQISKGLTESGNEKLTTFFGSTLNYLVVNFTNFTIWLAQALSPIGLIVLVYLLVHCTKQGIMSGGTQSVPLRGS